MAAPSKPLPAPLTDEERRKLVDLSRRYGAQRVAAALGVSRHLSLSAAAGLDIEASDAERIRARLSTIDVDGQIDAPEGRP